MNKKLLFLFVILFFACSSYSQDTLRILNGNLWIVKIDKLTKEEITFTSKDGKTNKAITRESRIVFSIREKGEKEVVIYKYNPDIGNYFEVNEMRWFMKGEREAHNYYSPKISNVGGIASSYAVSEGATLVAAAPLVFSSILMIPDSRVKRNEINQNYINNQPYREGYKRAAGGESF